MNVMEVSTCDTDIDYADSLTTELYVPTIKYQHHNAVEVEALRIARVLMMCVSNAPALCVTSLQQNAAICMHIYHFEITMKFVFNAIVQALLV
jgi:hypothetical protein